MKLPVIAFLVLCEMSFPAWSQDSPTKKVEIVATQVPEAGAGKESTDAAAPSPETVPAQTAQKVEAKPDLKDIDPLALDLFPFFTDGTKPTAATSGAKAITSADMFLYGELPPLPPIAQPTESHKSNLTLKKVPGGGYVLAPSGSTLITKRPERELRWIDGKWVICLKES